MNLDTHGSAAPTPTPTPKKKKKTIGPKTQRVINGIMGAVATVIKERDAKISTLSARLAALETQVAVQAKQITDGATLAFRGPWKSGDTYPRGAAVQHDGHLWIALRSTSDAPGGSDGWQLAVRRGREGKPGRDGHDARATS